VPIQTKPRQQYFHMVLFICKNHLNGKQLCTYKNSNTHLQVHSLSKAQVTMGTFCTLVNLPTAESVTLQTVEDAKCFNTLCKYGPSFLPPGKHQVLSSKYLDFVWAHSHPRVWKGILGIRDLTKIPYGIRENAKYLDGIRDLTATTEAGLAKI